MSDREVKAVVPGPYWVRLGADSDWQIGYKRRSDYIRLLQTAVEFRVDEFAEIGPSILPPATLPAEPARVSRGIEETIATEIVEIMQEYDRQEAANGYVDTPGGLEHMGDVWRLLGGWRRQIEADRQALAASRPPETAREEG